MSSDDPFDFFGLDRRTADEAALKAAYAAKLKTTRPDTDPQGFMVLREAFETAKRGLRPRVRVTPYTLLEPPVEPVFAEPPLPPLADPDNDREEIDTDRPRTMIVVDFGGGAPQQQGPPPRDGVFARITGLLGADDGALRRQELLELLHDPAVEDIDSFTWLSARVRQHVCDLTGFFGENASGPRWRAWTAGACLFDLQEHFGWDRQQTRNPWERAQNLWITRLSERVKQHVEQPEENLGPHVRRRRKRGGGYRHYTVQERAADSQAPDVRPVRREVIDPKGNQARFPIGVIVGLLLLLGQFMRHVVGG